MKLITKLALMFAVSAVSSSVLAETIVAPVSDNIMKQQLAQQAQTNQLLQALIAQNSSSAVSLTDTQKKTACVYDNKYYSGGALITVGAMTIRCGRDGDYPAWKDLNDGKTVSPDSK
ncbi:DUF1496 domain-containing protein [Pantoea allii]|uniref:DUF1496 domain-containing protein n=1 Tax=Pantoea allii TaxID=574096 RepID=UPI003D79C7F4